MKDFICSYRFEGRQYSFLLKADNHDQAKARVRCIKMACFVDGELMMEVPAKAGAGLFVRAVVFLRNLLR